MIQLPAAQPLFGLISLVQASVLSPGALFSALNQVPSIDGASEIAKKASQAVVEGAGDMFADLDDAEILLEYARIDSPPYVLAGVGLAIAVLCGLTFARLVQDRLEAWKQDRLPLLPLARRETMLPYIGLVLGVTLFIGASLQVFGFAAGAALLVAFLLSMATAGALWVQLARLMQQVEAGNFKAVDFDNFDEFF